MWVNLTNSEQCIFHVVFLELLNIGWLTVCWLLDWTASQLVEFLYWFCLSEYIIWNWKWCWFYCVISVDAGKRVGGIRLDSSTVILLFSYILMYELIYNLLLIICVWMISITVVWYFKYRKKYWDVEREFSKCILKMKYIYIKSMTNLPFKSS